MPLTLLRGNAGRAAPAAQELDAFESARAQSLAVRLEYALARLDKCAGYAQAEEYRALLNALLPAAQAKTLQRLESMTESMTDTIPSRDGIRDATRDAEWLAAGWEMLKPFQALAAELPEYRQYTSPESRRGFLENLINRLQSLDGELSAEDGNFWPNLARELATHWIALLKAEAENAREWLRIEAVIPPQQLRTGHQVLRVLVRNLSGVAARRLRLRVMQAADGLHCDALEVEVKLPLEPRQDTALNLTFSCETPGTYLLQGEVTAEDFSGNLARAEFSERLDIGLARRPYQVQKSAPYVAGSMLGDDRTFVERGETRHRLKALWRQPSGKPAVVLFGQRRIGKSTLLRKIETEDLTECGLLPIRIEVQGTSDKPYHPYNLLYEISTKITDALDLPAPELQETNPYPGFLNLLRLCRPHLEGRYFLIMLDEAERMWMWNNLDILYFLRKLMQGPEYPVLLLFCGTHELQRQARRHDSVLFNTVGNSTTLISYMSEAESKEVLEKPAQGILEYDPVALSEAYRLTHGQPYLLQLLGTVIIERFDSAARAGEPRSDYVSLRDMLDAAEDLVKRPGNSAFENYWADADSESKKLYSGLAWMLDETDRPHMDIVDIARYLREVRLEVPNLRERLEDLCEQGFLTSVGLTYRFTVPLFRRWLAWRWPPEKVK